MRMIFGHYCAVTRRYSMDCFFALAYERVPCRSVKQFSGPLPRGRQSMRVVRFVSHINPSQADTANPPLHVLFMRAAVINPIVLIERIVG
jgi:hypothetical protein